MACTRGSGARRPAGPTDPQRRAGRPRRQPARRPWSRRCSSATGASPGRPGRGRHHGHDHDDVEHRQQRSGRLSLASLDVHDGVKINLLDTPGLPRLRRRAARRAAGGGCRPVRRLGRRRRRRRDPDCCGRSAPRSACPRAVVVTKLDQRAGRLRRDARGLPAGLRRRRPAAVPAGADDARGAVAGLIGLLSQQVFDYSGGQASRATRTRSTSSVIEEHRDRPDRGRSSRSPRTTR